MVAGVGRYSTELSNTCAFGNADTRTDVDADAGLLNASCFDFQGRGSCGSSRQGRHIYVFQVFVAYSRFYPTVTHPGGEL